MSEDIYKLIEKYSDTGVKYLPKELPDIKSFGINYDDNEIEDAKLQGWGGISPSCWKIGNVPWNKGRSGLQDLTNLQKAREEYQKERTLRTVKRIRVGTWSPKADNTSTLNKTLLECPYCNKTGNYGNMKRWHFESCKWK